MTYQPLSQGIFTTVQPTLTNGQTNPLQLTSDGRLLVSTDAPTGGSSITSSSTAGGSLTVQLSRGAYYYVHMTGLTVSRISASAVTGSAILSVTSSGFAGSAPGWLIGNFIAAGTTMNDININFSSPVSGTYGASPSLSFPAAGTGVIWQVTAYYYTNNNATS